MSAGIDYGMGRTNINHETGIRYGVISQGAISQAWSDSSEADYGDATCPKCEGRAMSYLGIHSSFEQYEEHGCADYACEDCELTIDSSDCFGDEAIGWNVDADGYKMTDCLDSDVMILESPYFTFAPYCSPCVPGAGNLDSEGEFDESNGVKTYCVGHDWFEDGFAPCGACSPHSEAANALNGRLKMRFNPFEHVSGKYGAPMGRAGDAPTQYDGVSKLYARHCGGDGYYDRGGAYWGSPADVHAVWTRGGDFCCYVRAGGAAAAINQVAGSV